MLSPGSAGTQHLASSRTATSGNQKLASVEDAQKPCAAGRADDGAATREAEWRLPRNLNVEPPYDPAVPLGVTSGRTESRVPKTDLCPGS